MSCCRFLRPLHRSAFQAFWGLKSPKTRRLFLFAPWRFSAVWVRVWVGKSGHPKVPRNVLSLSISMTEHSFSGELLPKTVWKSGTAGKSGAAQKPPSHLFPQSCAGPTRVGIALFHSRAASAASCRPFARSRSSKSPRARRSTWEASTPNTGRSAHWARVAG